MASFGLIKKRPCTGARGEEDGLVVAASFRLERPLFRVEDFTFVGQYLRGANEFDSLRGAMKFSGALRFRSAKWQLLTLSSSGDMS